MIQTDQIDQADERLQFLIAHNKKKTEESFPDRIRELESEVNMLKMKNEVMMKMIIELRGDR
jgi:hypothetical protein